MRANQSTLSLANEIEGYFRDFLASRQPRNGSADLDRSVYRKLKDIIQNPPGVSVPLRGTIEEEEIDLEPMVLPIPDSLATINSLLKKDEELSNQCFSRSQMDELFLQQKKNQEDKITKRRLELEKAETRQVEVAKDWRLDFLNYHLQKNDMDKLKPNQDLNDNIVNFFLSMISTYMLDQNTRQKCHFFNTYFMSYLMSKDSLNDDRYIDKISKVTPSDFETKIAANYETVKKWTRKAGDIFKKDFILLPVNMPGHWSLIMVVRPHALVEVSKHKPYIIFMDSMGEKNMSVMEAVRIYLRYELRDKGNYSEKDIKINEETLPDYQLLLPRQTNFHDCGLYILTYAQSILLNKPVRQLDFSIAENRLQLRLFPRSLIFTMRYRIIEMLMNLSENQSPNEVIEKYLEKRQRLINDAVEVDYDELDEKQFRKYLSINNKNPKNKEEQINIKVGFYLKAELNFFELSEK